MIRILLADDHEILVEGMTTQLETQCSDISVVGTALDGCSVLTFLAADNDVDVVVLDYSMPKLNGVETIKRIVGRYPKVRSIILSAWNDGRKIDTALSAGSNGYVVKTLGTPVLIDAIRAVNAGRKYIDSTVQDALIDYLRAIGPYRKVLDKLTEQDIQIIRMYSQGKKADEIAQVTHVPPPTVRYHKAQIKKQLKIQSDAELFAKAREFGLLD